MFADIKVLTTYLKRIIHVNRQLSKYQNNTNILYATVEPASLINTVARYTSKNYHNNTL